MIIYIGGYYKPFQKWSNCAGARGSQLLKIKNIKEILKLFIVHNCFIHSLLRKLCNLEKDLSIFDDSDLAQTLNENFLTAIREVVSWSDRNDEMTYWPTILSVLGLSYCTVYELQL